MVKQIEELENRETNRGDNRGTNDKTTSSKYAGLGATIAAELMIGFYLGVGVILAITVVDSSNYCTGVLTISGNK